MVKYSLVDIAKIVTQFLIPTFLPDVIGVETTGRVTVDDGDITVGLGYTTGLIGEEEGGRK